VHESLWVDELHTGWCVLGDWQEVAGRAQAGNNGPLFFYLTRCATNWLGTGELALRSLSLTSGLVLIVVSYLVTRRWTQNGPVALATALLVGIDPHHIYFSLEARPYAMVQLVGLVQLATFWQLLRQDSARRRTLWVGNSILLFHLHYTAGWILFAEWAGWLWLSRRGVAYQWKQMAIDLTLIGAGCCLALPHVMAVAERRELWSAFVIAESPTRMFSLFPQTTLVAIALAGCAAIRLSVSRDTKTRQLSQRTGRLNLLLTVVFFAPVCGAWLLTAFELAPVFHRRYLIVVSVAGYLLFALLIADWGRWRTIALVILVSATVIRNEPLARAVRPDVPPVSRVREDWRGAVAAVNASEDADVPVFVRSHLIECDDLSRDTSAEFRDYCGFPLRSIYRLDESHGEPIPVPNVMDGSFFERVGERIRQKHGAWFVLRGTADEIEELCNTLEKWVGPTASIEQHPFGRLRLVHVTL